MTATSSPKTPLSLLLKGTKPPGKRRTRYERIKRYTISLTLTVSLVPLLISTVVNFYSFRSQVNADIHYEITRILTNTAQSITSIIEERRAAIELLMRVQGPGRQRDEESIKAALRNLRESFGGFVDLGVIDSQGTQLSYAGPYQLEGVDYSDQTWFHEVKLRDIYVSDVFLGYRQFPHFVIAVKRDLAEGGFYVLRATVDMALLTRQISLPPSGRASDLFLVNQQSVVQTPSRFHGEVLSTCSILVPPYSKDILVIEEYDERGDSFLLGYKYIENTPFVLLALKARGSYLVEWVQTSPGLLGMLLASVVLIVFVVLTSVKAFARQIQEADIRRAQVLHNAEYTNKMAAIGRLAASVAHEVNNPLAIINEKAGLLMDMIKSNPGRHTPEKALGILESILQSVDRCSSVTHRLLGFTRRMEPSRESIDLGGLLQEVSGFIGKETKHRNVRIETRFEPDVPPINSDRGQLQQIFLNLLNNALAAVRDGGYISCEVESMGKEHVQVTIADDGPGIPASEIGRIFEPFYSTKGEFGTGLGLSITYDLVRRLGGEISVESKVGEGARFHVLLPLVSA